MGRQQYDTYRVHEITKELLDGVKRGDLVKCNEWKMPLKVQATTENFFVASRKAFGEVVYSVCGKRKSNFNYGRIKKDMFVIGPDDWLFESNYDWETEGSAKEYLADFENNECAISVRNGVALFEISIKRV